MERVMTEFIFLGPKITADGNAAIKLKHACSLEEKLSPKKKKKKRKAIINLDSILKSRDITFLTNVHIVKAMTFLVIMYGCESWTIKNAECWRIDAFELWCWRRLLRVPWTARRCNQSILKEIGPEYSLEGVMLKLKLQYFVFQCEELTLWKRPWCWERLKAGGEGGQQRMSLLAAITDSMGMNLSKLLELVMDREAYHAAVHGLQRVRHDWVTELNWTDVCMYLYGREGWWWGGLM